MVVILRLIADGLPAKSKRKIGEKQAMGMGDRPKAFSPSYATIRDDVIGKPFSVCMMRSCPEPHVIKRYGAGGVANVSVYVCRKCRYRKEYELHGGVSCTYESAEK